MTPTARPLRSRCAALVALLALSLCAPAALAAKAHEHGAARADIAIDGRQLTVALEIPMDSLLGFERAPANKNERRAARTVLEQLREGGELVRPEAEAGCRFTGSQVEAPLLTGERGATDEDGHADVDVVLQFDCSQPGRLKRLDTTLFEAFPRLQRLEIQVAGPSGQLRARLQRPARTIPLTR